MPHPHPKMPPHPNCHHLQATLSGAEEAAPEDSTPVAGGAELAPEVLSSAASPALEVAIPAHMTPLHLQLGA